MVFVPQNLRHLRLALTAAAVVLLLIFGLPMLVRAAADGLHSLRYHSLSMAGLGNFPFDDEHGNFSDIPASKRALDGQRVSIEGKLTEIPVGNTEGDDATIWQFWLVPESWAYDGPLVQQRCLVNGLHDQVARYSLIPIRIDGRLHVSITMGDGYVARIFTLDADRWTPVPRGSGYTAARLTGVATAVLLLLARPLLTWRARRRIAKGLCQGCGYDLRGSPDRCPECGRHAITGLLADS